MHSHQIAVDALFVAAVTIIWFMLAYQMLLAMLGHVYYRRTRLGRAAPPLPDEALPRVSAIVPCHNEEKVIAHTIRALKALHYPEAKIEFLIVNDGSTDHTADIVREHTDDPRVRLIEVPESIAARGKSGALNFALHHARHEVLAIYDSDNLPEPGSLRPLAAELMRNPRLGAAIGMYRAWNRRRTLLTRFLNIEGISFQWILQAGRWMLMRLTTLPGTNYVIRKSLVEALGGWDEQALTEDTELSIRIYQAGYRIQLVPASVSWEQEPERFANWFRQRRRWVRGSNYVLRKHARNLWRTRPRRIGIELLYSLALYYVFITAVLVSNALFLLGLFGAVRIEVPGPFSVVWLFAVATFVLQVAIALSCEEGEDSMANILLTLLMYFSYCQLWIPVVAAAFWDDFIVRRQITWAKTERYEVDAA